MALRFGSIFRVNTGMYTGKFLKNDLFFRVHYSNLYVGKIVSHVAVSQVNSERSGKSAQNERRSFHGTAKSPLYSKNDFYHVLI